jgi:hypothetical protein
MESVTIQEMKSKIEPYRQDLKEKSGQHCRFSETGPVGMSVIDAPVAMIEAQQEQIDELRNDGIGA